MLETSWLWFVISKEYVELTRPKIESRDPIFFTGTQSRSRVSGNDRLFPRGSEFGPNLEIPAGPAIQLRPGPVIYCSHNEVYFPKLSCLIAADGGTLHSKWTLYNGCYASHSWRHKATCDVPAALWCHVVCGLLRRCFKRGFGDHRKQPIYEFNWIVIFIEIQLITLQIEWLK